MTYKISVVIPFFDEIDLISRAVQSVVINLEKFPGSEIIICNDGNYTKEEILETIGCSSKNPFLKIVNNENEKGPGGNRNTGINFSKNEIIAFLDADDYWRPGKISAQVELIRAGFNFISTAYEFENSKTIIKPPKKIENSIDVFQKRGLGTSTIVITTELMSQLRFSNIRFAQDIDFWFRLSQNQAFRYGAINKSFAVYSTNGSTKNKFEQLLHFNNVLALNRISVLKRLQILTKYSIIGVWNHYIKR